VAAWSEPTIVVAELRGMPLGPTLTEGCSGLSPGTLLGEKT
jgi:hypothetical protein